jgi:DNA recombination protein RmuC
MQSNLWIMVAGLSGVVVGAALVWWLSRASRASHASQTEMQAALLARLELQLGQLGRGTLDELGRVRDSLHASLSQQRQEITGTLAQTQQNVAQQTSGIAAFLGQSFKVQNELLSQQMTQIDARAEALRTGLGRHLAEMRTSVDTRLAALQAGNETKLDEMRQTVNEKLQATLEARLGASFKQVSERLEQVHRGLGEMASLATGVGDLKRVLTNVKTRGGWGEVQLQALLEQSLTSEQFARNVVTRPQSNERVDFAIRLPGRESSAAPVWLPLDAKFPREDYERLIDAQERGDSAAVETAGKALEAAIKIQAKSVRDKYLEPPHTTDFALLFLPTEGLYAEVLRRPGLADSLQREHRITIAGPTTLTALLNSLQMGFRTLAIERRSSEVWQVLGAVKAEFGKFAEVLGKVSEKLQSAQNEIEKTGVRTRAIERQLRGVEALPAEQTTAVLNTTADG